MKSHAFSNWRDRATTATSAVALVPSGANVFLHGAAATPTPLAEALAAREDVEGVSVHHLHTTGSYPFLDGERARRFRSVSFFVGEPVRRHIAEGRAEFMPVFLSDIPGLFLSGRIPLDVALVQLSPPDEHGYCSLGTSVDAARAAVDSARIVIAEINERVPRTHGASSVRFDRISAFVATDRALYEAPRPEISPVEARIGELVAGLVEDGATLQMGIGAIPDAVLARLENKVDLGVHTEMFSDGLLPLLENGVVTNRLKVTHPGHTVTSFVSGTQKLFDFVNDNPRVLFESCDRTNDTALIRKNPRVTAINSAIELDITGQICADSIGARVYSGIGGQMDFIRGAALSTGGKAIIALPSTAAGGKFSRIVTQLKAGAGVVTTRGHVHWVVTEYGAVDLHGKTLRQRADLLAGIAHPDFRAELREQAGLAT
jgi:4-hydroxybutyrate CoA-transferase